MSNFFRRSSFAEYPFKTRARQKEPRLHLKREEDEQRLEQHLTSHFLSSYFSCCCFKFCLFFHRSLFSEKGYKDVALFPNFRL